MTKKTLDRTTARIVLLGTPQFVVPIFDYFLQQRITPVAVITQPDEKVGRKKVVTPPPVKVWATSHGLPVYQPRTKKELHEALTELQPDICILVAYGMLIPSETLSLPAFGFLNIHPSLLPQYRGPSPIQTALLNGEKKTGVSIMLLDEKMDHGPLLAQEAYAIKNTETNETIHEKLGLRGAALVDGLLDQYLAGDIEPKEQNHEQATFSRIISRVDGEIDWNQSAAQIIDKYRAFQPWPGIFTTFRGKRLKIAKIGLQEAVKSSDLIPGTVYQLNDVVAVSTGAGTIVLERIQLEGKSLMSAQDFARGYTDFIGSTLG